MQITDEAVEAAAMRIAEWSFEEDPTYKWDDLDAEDKDSAREGMRAALEAARPHLAPQPTLPICPNCEGEHFTCGACGIVLDAMAAPQPVVDREAVLQLLDDYAVGRYIPGDLAEHRGSMADAIERLLTGSAK